MAIALVVCAALPWSRLAIAGSATVTCCCGPHDAEHDCGCDTCPAGKGSGATERGAGPRLASCNTDVDPGTAPAPLLAILPAPPVVGAPAVRPWRSSAPAAPVPARTLAPPCPDG